MYQTIGIQQNTKIRHAKHRIRSTLPYSFHFFLRKHQSKLLNNYGKNNIFEKIKFRTDFNIILLLSDFFVYIA